MPKEAKSIRKILESMAEKAWAELTAEQLTMIELSMNAVHREWKFYDLVQRLGEERPPLGIEVFFQFFMRLRAMLDEAE